MPSEVGGMLCRGAMPFISWTRRASATVTDIGLVRPPQAVQISAGRDTARPAGRARKGGVDIDIAIDDSNRLFVAADVGPTRGCRTNEQIAEPAGGERNDGLDTEDGDRNEE